MFQVCSGRIFLWLFWQSSISDSWVATKFLHGLNQAKLWYEFITNSNEVMPPISDQISGSEDEWLCEQPHKMQHSPSSTFTVISCKVILGTTCLSYEGVTLLEVRRCPRLLWLQEVQYFWDAGWGGGCGTAASLHPIACQHITPPSPTAAMTQLKSRGMQQYLHLQLISIQPTRCEGRKHRLQLSNCFHGAVHKMWTQVCHVAFIYHVSTADAQTHA